MLSVANIMTLSRSFSLLATMTAALVGCGGGDGNATAPDTKGAPPTTIAILTGTNVAGTVGQQLPVTVQLSSSGGAPSAGFGLEFVVTGGRGSVSGSSARTASNGQSSVTWTLGTTSGTQTLEVRVSGQTAIAPVTITATAAAGTPAMLVSTSPHFEAIAGQIAATPPSVRVSDSHGNAAVGIPVRFEFVIPGPGGTLSTSDVQSDTNGVASAGTWRAGMVAGGHQLSARVISSGSTLSPAILSLRVLADVPKSIAAVTTVPTFATVGSTIATRPTVRVRDQYDNAVAGKVVVFSGDNYPAVTGVTDSSGFATGNAPWILPTIVGMRSLTASLQQAPHLSVAFTVTATADQPARLIIQSADGQTATAGEDVSDRPTVRVVDRYDNSVAGTGIIFRVTQGGGSVSGSPAVSDTNGIARVSRWILGRVPGRNTLVAEVSGNPSVTATFVATGNAAPLNAVSLAAGTTHTCAVASGGFAYCWGDNRPVGGDVGGGQLGVSAATGLALSPVLVGGGVPLLRQVFVGRKHTCGLTPDGVAYCWGTNTDGQVGDGTNATRYSPTPVATSLRFMTMALGWDFSCGIATTGLAYCWGSNRGYGTNQTGQLGNGSFVSSNTPVMVFGNRVYTAIAAGDQHACAVASTGTIWCWGANNGLGIGGSSNSPVPVQALMPVSARRVFASRDGSCAVSTDSALYCWGSNGNAQLAIPDALGIVSRPTRAAIGFDWAEIAMGDFATCGLTIQGRAFCWGQQFEGNFGNGIQTATSVTVTSPTPIAGGVFFQALAFSGWHGCGLAVTTGATYCWGNGARNGSGQGFTSYVPIPVARP